MTDWDQGTRRATDGLDWRSPEPAPSAPLSEPPGAAVAPPRVRQFGLGMVALVAGASALLGGVLAGLIVTTLDEDRPAAQQGTNTAADGGNGGTITVEQTSAIVEVAAKSRDSVVRIESKNSDGRDIGSGIVFDERGYVVTNAHVVLQTADLRVILPSGEERPAILLGHDFPFTDVAVLQIGPGGLKALPFADSTRLALGEAVVAIGNPLAEFDGTVTVGVVSGLDRSRVFDNVRYTGLIQTDAAVNSGNSGGALLNLQGEVVGMPTSIIRESNSGSIVEGIAFAIPSNQVLDVAALIIQEGGNPVRPSLQLEHADITPEVLSRIRGLTVDEGALVISVPRGSISEPAGIIPGDVIVTLGGVTVDLETPLYNALLQHEPGETVPVVLNRNGQIIETEVRLAIRE